LPNRIQWGKILHDRREDDDMNIDLTGGTVLPVITDADPMLKRPSAAIGEPTEEIRQLARDMLATMYEQRGIGLAAVQVARPLRMLVLDAGTPETRRPMVMIDPVIEWAKKRGFEMEEGCLSLPGRRVPVTRPSDIKVTYTDLEGNRVTRDLGGMPARIVQHEIDHLDGILITDRRAA
jgi:peptide deformylase